MISSSAHQKPPKNLKTNRLRTQFCLPYRQADKNKRFFHNNLFTKFMNQKRFSNTVLVIVLLLFVLIAGYFLLIKKPDLLNPPLVRTPFEYLGNFDSPSSLGCISTFDSIENRESREREFVINSGEEYQSLITYKSISSLCKDFVLPTIRLFTKRLY